jgi:hypothetical protein
VRSPYSRRSPALLEKRTSPIFSHPHSTNDKKNGQVQIDLTRTVRKGKKRQSTKRSHPHSGTRQKEKKAGGVFQSDLLV